MKQIDIAGEMRKHVANKYDSQRSAAKAWGVTASMVSAVLAGSRRPNRMMLTEAGFELVKPDPFYRKVKKEK